MLINKINKVKKINMFLRHFLEVMCEGGFLFFLNKILFYNNDVRGNFRKVSTKDF